MNRSVSRGSRLLQAAHRPTATAPACSASRVRLAHKLVEVELRQEVLGLGSPGDRLPVAPGRARSLFKELRALYVVKGRTISPMRDLIRRADTQAEKQRIRDSKARGELQPKPTVSVDEVDPRVAALAAETDLRTALSLVPTPLTFHRRLIHTPAPSSPSLPGQPTSESAATTSNEIFGSVSVLDVVAVLREFGVVVEEANAAFEEQQGVEKARLKATGVYSLVVNFKALGESATVKVEVLREV